MSGGCGHPAIALTRKPRSHCCWRHLSSRLRGRSLRSAMTGPDGKNSWIYLILY